MNLSVVINTCALGPRAASVTGSTTPTPHSARAYALHEFILPTLASDPNVSEVIVVGEFEEGDGYVYVPCPSRAFSCVDALAQRQAGFEASSGDVVLFMHDDHALDARASWYLKHLWRFFDADVVVPTRLQRRPAKVLNNGLPAYVGGHAAAYARWTLEAAPWGAVPKVHTWDVEHTRMLREAGARIVESHETHVYDIEYGVDE